MRTPPRCRRQASQRQFPWQSKPAPDVEQSNGVIHVIDKVLLPKM
ncbi:fasciclin domain-containing protein [Mesorhizobium sp. ES1-3]|nr:fasciclin domain-containing protein [Mesorhizobium sp. ES1-3]MBZ9669745.1 fasciclin domain-containing protein [Mesorhizobium sp. ES1-3]